MSDQITSIVTEAIHRVCNHYSCGEIQDELVQAVLVAVQEVVVSPHPEPCQCNVYETCDKCRGTRRDLSVCHCDYPYLCGMKRHKETWRCLRCGRHPSADEEVFVSYVDEIEVKLSDALALLAAVVVSPVPQLQDLHQQIMNIPCRVPLTYANHAIRTRAYEIGHRDARHAAAELVAGAAARPETDQK